MLSREDQKWVGSCPITSGSRVGIHNYWHQLSKDIIARISKDITGSHSPRILEYRNILFKDIIAGTATDAIAIELHLFKQNIILKLIKKIERKIQNFDSKVNEILSK